MLKKESGFSVTEDYTKRIREERQELYNFKCAEQKDGQKAVIRYNKLYLDEDVFMFDWEIEKVKWVGKRPPLGKQKDSGPNSDGEEGATGGQEENESDSEHCPVDGDPKEDK